MGGRTDKEVRMSGLSIRDESCMEAERHLRSLKGDWMAEKEALEEYSKLFDLRRVYDRGELGWTAYKLGTGPRGVTVTCYRKSTVWVTRNNAMAFYRDAMACSEGCERERYTNVFMDLLDGLMECSDGMEW